MNYTAAPTNWNDFYFHANAVKLIQNFLNKNQHPYSIFVSGAKGVGKTSLINLYMQSVLAAERLAEPPKIKQDSSQDAKQEEPPKIIRINKSNDGSIHSQLSDAIAWTQIPVKGHRFVVVENAQLIPHQYLQELLFHTELPTTTGTNKVTFIFECQDELLIDRQLLQAIKDRSTCIRLPRLTSSEVVKVLIKKSPYTPLESISTIARSAEGNLAQAIDNLSALRDSHPDAAAHQLYPASAGCRRDLWNALNKYRRVPNKSTYAALRGLWESLAGTNEKRLVELLFADLDRAMLVAPSHELLRAKFMFDGCRSAAPIRPFDAFKMLDCVEIPSEVFDASNVRHYERNGFERVNESILLR